MKSVMDLLHKDDGTYSKVHVFAFVLAALHVGALGLWVYLTVRQRPATASERVDPSKDD
ncbi:unnamed product [Ostreococcus tauri]|uniref:Unnamed product n=1 Tax=Ostreococcus tauri TaxID=70448 RepID=Q00WC9_OSTTA|nr:unnamed product [Ostreococcus tauri]OUS45849.1 hypothetical protein BE221DRAFT_205980 [Ostreococcus tauri]CAL56829.1 unnamed product [Ostreococcus tauri]|eukprot:XP_003082874.1 unnamed product [Ostreococcus tauri]